MINLLPADFKKTVLYARRNLLMTKWAVSVSIAVTGIGLIIAGGYLYINQSTKAYAKEVQSRKETLAQQDLEATQKRTEDISASTKLASQVLSRQVLFSELLRQTGAVMPAGAALQNLSVSKLEGGIDLQAVAADYQTATQVQVNLTDKENRIFEKADIISIQCSSNPSNSTDARYPCQISIRALFARDSPFVFTNTSASAESTR